MIFLLCGIIVFLIVIILNERRENMGIWTSAYLMVGLPYSDLEDAIEAKKEAVINEWLLDNPGKDENNAEEAGVLDDFFDFYMGLDRASPRYDCPDDYCIFGITIMSDYNGNSTSLAGLIDSIENAQQEFLNKTGLVGHILVTPNVY